MKPVEKWREIGMAGRRRQAAIAVFADDVFDDRAGFSQHQIAIDDDRRRSDRMQRLVVRLRQHGDGIARMAFQLVWNFQLLAKPDDAFRLRLAEMMDDEHERPRWRRR